MTATTPSVPVVRTCAVLGKQLDVLRRSGATLGLVPTMGSLHPGHLSLVELAGEVADATVVSVFVNPLQFGPGEDFGHYPRDLEHDVELAAAHGAGLVFAPGDEEMYPAGEPRIHVDPGRMGEELCGRFRPDHFRGVLTVVAKLFGLIRPDVAIFGRKDFQQCVLVRQMVHDLELGVSLAVAPTVREPDGLALSSRNGHLGPEERRDAAGLSRALFAAQEAFQTGESDAGAFYRIVDSVATEHKKLRLQYVECVDPATLAPVVRCDAGTVLVAAALCGGTRLIDNVVLGGSDPDPRVARDPLWFGD